MTEPKFACKVPVGKSMNFTGQVWEMEGKDPVTVEQCFSLIKKPVPGVGCRVTLHWDLADTWVILLNLIL